MKKMVRLILSLSVVAALILAVTACSTGSFSLPNTETVKVGESKQIALTNTTEIEGDVEWSSDKTNIATVSKTGLVTGVAVGEAKITAKLGSKSATCTVTVTAAAEEQTSYYGTYQTEWGFGDECYLVLHEDGTYFLKNFGDVSIGTFTIEDDVLTLDGGAEYDIEEVDGVLTIRGFATTYGEGDLSQTDYVVDETAVVTATYYGSHDGKDIQIEIYSDNTYIFDITGGGGAGTVSTDFDIATLTGTMTLTDDNDDSVMTITYSVADITNPVAENIELTFDYDGGEVTISLNTGNEVVTELFALTGVSDVYAGAFTATLTLYSDNTCDIEIDFGDGATPYAAGTWAQGQYGAITVTLSDETEIALSVVAVEPDYSVIKYTATYTTTVPVVGEVSFDLESGDITA